MNSCKLWMEFTEFPNHAQVILITDRFKDEGIPKGSIGQIIEAAEDEFYKVDFGGAQIMLKGMEIRLEEK